MTQPPRPVLRTKATAPLGPRNKGMKQWWEVPGRPETADRTKRGAIKKALKSPRGE